MRIHTRAALLAAALALPAGAALANDPQTPPITPTPTAPGQPAFEDLDTNKDGRIAKDEVPDDHELETLFASFDDDADQALSRVEFDQYAVEEEEESE